MDKLPDLEPVKLRCGARDCDNDRHSYRPKLGAWKELSSGVCLGCGDTSVNMNVTRAKDANRPAEIFRELGREFIRDHFLHKPFDERARRLIQRDGVDGIRSRICGRVLSSIGGEPTIYDGRQTPLEGNVLYYAQHATATCCRRCAWYWYGIPRTGELDDLNLTFCEQMIDAYVNLREDEIAVIHREGPGR